MLAINRMYNLIKNDYASFTTSGINRHIPNCRCDPNMGSLTASLERHFVKMDEPSRPNGASDTGIRHCSSETHSGILDVIYNLSVGIERIRSLRLTRIGLA